MFILSILLTIIVGSMIATGVDDEYTSGFVDGLSSILNIKWMYSGMTSIARGINTVSRSLQMFDPVSLFTGLMYIVGGFATAILSIVTMVLSGYISISMFVVGFLPGIVRPLGIFIALSLIFVQLCALWVIAKYIYSLARSLLEVLFGRTFY